MAMYNKIQQHFRHLHLTHQMVRQHSVPPHRVQLHPTGQETVELLKTVSPHVHHCVSLHTPHCYTLINVRLFTSCLTLTTVYALPEHGILQSGSDTSLIGNS